MLRTKNNDRDRTQNISHNPNADAVAFTIDV